MAEAKGGERVQGGACPWRREREREREREMLKVIKKGRDIFVLHHAQQFVHKIYLWIVPKYTYWGTI